MDINGRPEYLIRLIAPSVDAVGRWDKHKEGVSLVLNVRQVIPQSLEANNTLLGGTMNHAEYTARIAAIRLMEDKPLDERWALAHAATNAYTELWYTWPKDNPRLSKTLYGTADSGC